MVSEDSKYMCGRKNTLILKIINIHNVNASFVKNYENFMLACFFYKTTSKISSKCCVKSFLLLLFSDLFVDILI